MYLKLVMEMFFLVTAKGRNLPKNQLLQFGQTLDCVKFKEM